MAKSFSKSDFFFAYSLLAVDVVIADVQVGLRDRSVENVFQFQGTTAKPEYCSLATHPKFSIIYSTLVSLKLNVSKYIVGFVSTLINVSSNSLTQSLQGTLLSHTAVGRVPAGARKNWARNISYAECSLVTVPRTTALVLGMT